ncbi:diversity-generating retroelement protein Avd [Leptothoe sp. EHU-05/26/07-4]
MLKDLPIIQKTYDLVKWYVPIINKLPREHRFLLGDRIITELYNLLEILVVVRYQRQKLPQLQQLNGKLDVLRYQTRLLLEFDLISHKRYQYAGQLINAIGTDLGGWIKQQQAKTDGERPKPKQPMVRP